MIFLPPTSSFWAAKNMAWKIFGTPAMTKVFFRRNPGAEDTGLSSKVAPTGI